MTLEYTLNGQSKCSLTTTTTTTMSTLGTMATCVNVDAPSACDKNQCTNRRHANRVRHNKNNNKYTSVQTFTGYLGCLINGIHFNAHYWLSSIYEMIKTFLMYLNIPHRTEPHGSRKKKQKKYSWRR